MVISPRSTPKLSWSTLTIVAMQLVVQEALLMMLWLPASYLSSLTPRTTVRSSPLAGAEIMTFLAPASMCPPACSASVNIPVDSTTISAPRSSQGRSGGVALGQHPDLGVVYPDAVAGRLDLSRVAAIGRVVLEQPRDVLRVAEVVDGDNLQ